MNKTKRCIGCPYNQTKKEGGYGRICNGLTMQKHNRCPEWRISEIIKLTERAYSSKQDYHTVRP